MPKGHAAFPEGPGKGEKEKGADKNLMWSNKENCTVLYLGRKNPGTRTCWGLPPNITHPTVWT